jgi:hypothetical protein
VVPARESDPETDQDQGPRPGATTDVARPRLGWLPKVGIGAWSFVGVVAATTIVVAALSAASEIALPLTFAAVLAVLFQPVVERLERHKVRASYAAG